MRITLDTNVIVSGLLSANGPPGELLDAWIAHAFVLVTSPYQLAEMRRVASYPRLRERIPQELLSNVIERMGDLAHVVGTDLPPIDASPDPADNPIIATALTGDAELLVSGDRSHLLELKSVQGLRIVGPREAISSLKF